MESALEVQGAVSPLLPGSFLKRVFESSSVSSLFRGFCLIVFGRAPFLRREIRLGDLNGAFLFFPLAFLDKDFLFGLL